MGLEQSSLAFYLPQFHPVPENDEWWEPGFTEWTNVAAARPLFRGHAQPHLPGDLGFYDLRVGETRIAQSALAKEASVDGFVYWHYWFGGGRTILDRPLYEVVNGGEPDFPFCVAWANQTWSGIWHGAPNRVLMAQEYPGDDDHRAHFDSLLPILTDPRYFRVDGRPLIYIFRPAQIPSCASFVDLWRSLAQESGVGEIYVVGQDALAPESLGLDAGVLLPSPTVGMTRRDALQHPASFIRYRYSRRRGPLRLPYEVMTQRYLERLSSLGEHGARIHRGVLTGWDNTPRSGRRGVVLTGYLPELLEGHSQAVYRDALSSPGPQSRIVFVKSWNEWAEGNYLEPDRERRRSWMEAHRVGRLRAESPSSL